MSRYYVLTERDFGTLDSLGKPILFNGDQYEGAFVQSRGEDNCHSQRYNRLNTIDHATFFMQQLFTFKLDKGIYYFLYYFCHPHIQKCKYYYYI